MKEKETDRKKKLDEVMALANKIADITLPEGEKLTREISKRNILALLEVLATDVAVNFTLSEYSEEEKLQEYAKILHILATFVADKMPACRKCFEETDKDK